MSTGSASVPPAMVNVSDQPAASSSTAPAHANGSAAHAPEPANGAMDVDDVKPSPGPAGVASDMPQAFAARREEELARRDRSLAELLVMLDGYKPLIPEEVTEYYLQRSGFECSDPRLKRLLSLSAQKFVSDLAKDAYHYAKIRVNSNTAGRGRPAAGTGVDRQDKNRVVLTMDDLSLALGEHGVNAKKPDYYL